MDRTVLTPADSFPTELSHDVQREVLFRLPGRWIVCLDQLKRLVELGPFSSLT